MSKAAPKVILYVASSVDGYIARPDGAVDWLEPAPEPAPEPAEEAGEDYGYREFIAGVGVVLMGRITYEQILSFGVDYPYPDAAGYVFSRTRAGEQDDNVRFVDVGDIAGLVARLRAEQDKNLWLVGGGQLVREFLRLDLIDRIETIYPADNPGRRHTLIPAGYADAKPDLNQLSVLRHRPGAVNLPESR